VVTLVMCLAASRKLSDCHTISHMFGLTMLIILLHGWCGSPDSSTGFYYQNEWEIQMCITWFNASEKLV